MREPRLAEGRRGHHTRGIATPGRGTGGPGAEGGGSSLLGARCLRQRMREQRCPNHGLERRTARASRAPGPPHRTPAQAQPDPAGPRIPRRGIPNEGGAARAAEPGPRSNTAADPDPVTAASLSPVRSMSVRTNQPRTMSVHDRERLPGQRPQLLHGVDDQDHDHHSSPAITDTADP
jgi:hypothetical protein